jgi:serine/threonine-protein kinase 24/25/MST4
MAWCDWIACFRLPQMRPGPIGEVYIAIIVREVLKGIEYLHGERKLHRDIKGMSSFSATSLAAVAARLLGIG